MTVIHTVVAIVATNADRRRLARLARTLRFNLRCFRAARDAVRFILPRSVLALVASPTDAAGQPTAPVLAAIRRDIPSLGVVVLIERTPRTGTVLPAVRHADELLFGDQLTAASLWTAVYTAGAKRRRTSRKRFTSAPTRRV